VKKEEKVWIPPKIKPASRSASRFDRPRRY
jgi:hypothetical protein